MQAGWQRHLATRVTWTPSRAASRWLLAHRQGRDDQPGAGAETMRSHSTTSRSYPDRCRPRSRLARSGTPTAPARPATDAVIRRTSLAATSMPLPVSRDPLRCEEPAQLTGDLRRCAARRAHGWDGTGWPDADEAAGLAGDGRAGGAAGGRVTVALRGGPGVSDVASRSSWERRPGTPSCARPSPSWRLSTCSRRSAGGSSPRGRSRRRRPAAGAARCRRLGTA